ncbi:VTT domain-containing protein [Tsukamurella sp. 8F]|uniref:VTT domain-containing protein n=1 Tax=unclassified Tsukamurella TaxID=2633480 RepID=UPI0023B9209B|nr:MULTISPECIES: VTT domain-containing protein [unclassified Tsukamurella]MDF0530961.1 VTT domain-containing protein [Tsukamurella sp. 8J]MDF0588286.1 VTT domain-containing protein [Tsukamurella sp. 8F]
MQQASALGGLLDPVTVLNKFGAWVLAGLLLVVFVESGVLFPILPGDSLLFTAGLVFSAGAASDIGYTGAHNSWLLPATLILVPIAAILGAQVGYLVGRFGGSKLFTPEARILKKKYLDESHAFFEKYGPVTICLARFVPIVRTFAPLVAGAARMRYATFTLWNVIGSIAWGVGVTVLGVFLGKIKFVRDNIDAIFIIIVLVSVVPIAWEALKRVRNSRRVGTDTPQG